MPIFGYNAIGVNSLGLTDTDLFGNFNNARIAMRGNPVLGGNLVTAHVNMIGPLAGVNQSIQIGVYDATGGVPPAFPLVATSAVFNLPVGSPQRWWVTPIVGALVAGNSYVAAVLGFNGDPSRGSIYNDPIPNEYVMQNFIAPGVFPNPLGIGNNATREWSLYVTYVLDADGAGSYNAACCCLPHGNSNMNM